MEELVLWVFFWFFSHTELSEWLISICLTNPEMPRDSRRKFKLSAFGTWKVGFQVAMFCDWPFQSSYNNKMLGWESHGWESRKVIARLIGF